MSEMFKESKAEDVTQSLSGEDTEEMDLKGTRRENQQDSVTDQNESQGDGQDAG